mgnify:FL=1
MLKHALQPQEVEVFYIIPAIRSSFARHLKEAGKSQKEVASLLGIRESTVSQYVHAKRANHIIFEKKIEDEVRKSVSRMSNNTDVIREIQYLLNVIKRTKTICDIHFQVTKELPKGCEACFEAERMLKVGA